MGLGSVYFSKAAGRVWLILNVRRRMKDTVHRLVLLLAGAYCFASFTHFFHNAEFCGEYPNLPAWISRTSVYWVWLALTALGATGVFLFQNKHRATGLALVSVYAALGFAGLGHYGLAPISRHSAVMNLTIWFEVAAAAVLLTVTLRALTEELRCRPKN